jgi:hypothetical protein
MENVRRQDLVGNFKLFHLLGLFSKIVGFGNSFLKISY